MKSATMAVALLAVSPLQAVINCHDYTHFRVTNGIDPHPAGGPKNASGISQKDLTDKLSTLGYRLAVDTNIKDRPPILCQ